MLKNIQSHLSDKRNRHYVIALSIFLLFVFILIGLRIQAAFALRKRTQEAAVTVVAIMVAKKAPGTDKIMLPGSVWAWHEAPIFARTDGYIKDWYVDIGSKVKAGELLALIETPEIDAQERQAEADLKTAIANNNLAQTTAKRWLY